MLEEILDEAASVSEELTIGGRNGKKGDFEVLVFDEGVDKDHQAIGWDGKNPPPTVEDGQKDERDVTHDEGGGQQMHQFESLGITPLEHHTGLAGVFHLVEK